jgi:hypothetical protein
VTLIEALHEPTAPNVSVHGVPFYLTRETNMRMKWWLSVLAGAMALSGCSVLAVADAAGSAVVYGIKTTVNVLDAVTPDIVNKPKD